MYSTFTRLFSSNSAYLAVGAIVTDKHDLKRNAVGFVMGMSRTCKTSEGGRYEIQ